MEEQAKKSSLAEKDIPATAASLAGCHVSIEECLAQLGEEARALASSLRPVFEYIWPNDTPPAVLSKLAGRLEGGAELSGAVEGIIVLEESTAVEVRNGLYA